MQTHIKILAVVHIVPSGIVIGGALLFLALFVVGELGIVDAAFGENSNILRFLPVLGGPEALVLLFIVLLSLPGLVAGYGLLKLKPWARTLAILLSAIDLVAFPLGTAIGVYGLWVLLNQETKLFFQQPASG